MPKIETWQCATCGRLKGESNNWWLAGTWGIKFGKGFYIKPMEMIHNRFAGYDEDAYCSAECLLKRQSKYMETAHEKV